jgi:uncharacterized protein YjgD (DUF1641 family)
VIRARNYALGWVDRAEPVLASFEVLQDLHNQRVRELLRGMLGGGDKILEIVVQATKTPEAVRGIRNPLIMTKVLGSIEPELLERFAQAVPDALVGVSKAELTEPPGFWGVLKIFGSKNLRRGLAVVNNLLEAWGRNFSTQKKF